MPVSLVVARFAAHLFASHAFVGTWKQNRAKAETPDALNAITIEPAPGGIAVKNAVGAWFTAKFDGREAPTVLIPSDRVKYKRIDNRPFQMVLLREGKQAAVSRFEASDGTLGGR